MQASASAVSRTPLIMYSACHTFRLAMQLRAWSAYSQPSPMMSPGGCGGTCRGSFASPNIRRKVGAKGRNSVADTKARSTCKVPGRRNTDRKSTRLNSSHLGISYAVFCLKKKNSTQHIRAAYTSSDDTTPELQRATHL